MPAPLHPREHDRVAAVKSLRIMDSEPVPDLERIAELSAALCGVPFGSVNIIDFDRHYTAASFGAPRIHASRADSLCALAVADDKIVYAPTPRSTRGSRAFGSSTSRTRPSTCSRPHPSARRTACRSAPCASTGPSRGS